MIREAIEAVVSGESLSMEAAAQVMNEIMSGEATPAQFGAFVTALRLKGETVDEIAGMAQVMREHSLHVEVDGNSGRYLRHRRRRLRHVQHFDGSRIRCNRSGREGRQARQPCDVWVVRQCRCAGGAGRED